MTSAADWTDRQLTCHALTMWANYIETGDVVRSAADNANMKEPVKALTLDQMRMVVRLRDLAARSL